MEDQSITKRRRSRSKKSIRKKSSKASGKKASKSTRKKPSRASRKKGGLTKRVSKKAAAKGAANAKKNAPAAPASTKWGASVFPKDGPVDETLVQCVQKIEEEMNVRALLLLHGGVQCPDWMQVISRGLADLLVSPQTRPLDKAPLLILDSYGGDAHGAYMIARRLQQMCGSFSVLVPRCAKSAGTLLALGAEKIYLGPFAELGPLDAQVSEDNDEPRSALEDAMALERLVASSLRSLDSTMHLFLRRQPAGMTMSKMTAVSADYSSNLMRPLFEKLDALRFGRLFRTLLIGEKYAVRLLERTPQADSSERIASTLVHDYPSHSFAIDFEEARRIGLQVQAIPAEIETSVELLRLLCFNSNVVGSLKEIGSGS